MTLEISLRLLSLLPNQTLGIDRESQTGKPALSSLSEEFCEIVLVFPDTSLSTVQIYVLEESPFYKVLCI